MSNKKVREQIEAKEVRNTLLTAYKKKADLILNYQMCKAYYKDSALSILSIVEKILKAKYNLPWQEKIIRRVLAQAKGKSNAIISIPQFKYEKNVNDILAEFVERNFDRMVADRKANGMYPIALTTIIERYYDNRLS